MSRHYPSQILQPSNSKSVTIVRLIRFFLSNVLDRAMVADIADSGHDSDAGALMWIW